MDELNGRILHGWGQSVDRWDAHARPYFEEVGIPVLISDYVALSDLREEVGLRGELARMASWTASDGSRYPFIVMECITHEFNTEEIITALNSLGYEIDPTDPLAYEEVQALMEDPLIRAKVAEIVNLPDAQIAQGDWDAEIIQFAEIVASSPRPVLVRIMQEFLGGVHGNDVTDAATFTSAWQHIVDLMRAHGAQNAEFVWHPNKGNEELLAEWWPGDDYVDWVGISIFSSADFDEARTHNAFALSHGKPFLIAESAPTLNEFADRGTADPATWDDYFRPYFDLIRSEPNIKAFFYINIDWSDSPFDWPTSRVQENSLIHDNYVAELEDPVYVYNWEFWSSYDPSAFSGHLMFSSGFEGGVTVEPFEVNKHKLVGLDTLTGFSWDSDFPALKGTFQYQIEEELPDAFVSTELVSMTGPQGENSRVLEMQVFQDHPGDEFITRNNYNVKPLTDGSFQEGYVRYWMCLQDDFLTAWPGGDGAWKIIMEWMEETPPGGDNFNWRMGIEIKELEGEPRFLAYAELGNPTQDDWYRWNPYVPVPIGEWFLLEAYWKIGPESGENQGRLWFAVNEQTVIDYSGRTQHPDNPLPVNRWFPFKNYQYIDSWSAPAVQWIDDFEWWSGFPENRVQEVPAFPGAEGFGTQTPGGRNGAVVRVTSLEDSGTGTLREALMLKHPRTIVFDVAGTIHLEKPLFLGGEPGESFIGDNPYSFVTIAGQTAPGGGVTITNFPLSIRNGVHDVVVRHLRFRNQIADPTKSSIGDGVQLAGCYHVVLDHLSVAWATDEGFSLEASPEGPIHDVTIQNCLVAETLSNGDHPKQNPHSRGMVISDGARNISVHHNFFISCNRRNPSLGGNSDVNQSEFPFSDVRYNLIYNFGEKGIQFSGGAQANIVGNIVRFGPDTIASTIFDAPDPQDNGTTVYLEGNTEIRRIGEEDIETTPADQTSLVTEDTPGVVAYALEPFDDVPIITPPAGNLEAWILANAGAHPRDTHDSRFLVDYENFDGRLGADDLTHAELTVIAPESGVPLADTDNDGLSDNWETAFGLNPNDPLDAIEIAGDTGFTQLEIALSQISDAQVESSVQSYELWLPLHFSESEITDIEISGQMADPDGDGADNLLEYLLGTSPTIYTSIWNHYLFLKSNYEKGEGSYLSLGIIHHPRPTLEVFPESSSDLVEWQSKTWYHPETELGGGLLHRNYHVLLDDSPHFLRITTRNLQP